MAVAWLVPAAVCSSTVEHVAAPPRWLSLLLLVDADAALLRDGGGVDAVHILRALQQAGDGGVADQVGFGLGERAAVDEINGLDAALAGLGEE